MKTKLFPVAFALSGRGTLEDKTAAQILDAFLLRIMSEEVYIMFKGDPLLSEPLADGNDLLRASFSGEVGNRNGFLFWTKAPDSEQMALFEEMLRNHEVVGTFVLGGRYKGKIFVQTKAGVFTLDLTDMDSPVFMLDADNIPAVVGFVNEIPTPRAAVLYSGPVVEPEVTEPLPVLTQADQAMLDGGVALPDHPVPRAEDDTQPPAAIEPEPGSGPVRPNMP